MTKEKLRELVFINLGQASMCWSEIPKGVFNSTKAVELGEEIMKAIDEYVEAQEEPGWRDPLVDYLDWEENKNKESEWQRRRRLEVMKEAEKKEKENYDRSLKELNKKKEEREEKELIKKILADPSNASGFEDFDPDRPQYFFEGFKYVLNDKLDRIIKVEVPTDFVQRKWLMDDLREQQEAWERIKESGFKK